MATMHDWDAAMLAFNTRDYRTAIERLHLVLADEPSNLNAREYLARSHYQRASLPLAEAETRAILEQDPANEYVTLLLARILERQSRADEAAGVRRRLVALTGDPRHGDNHHALS